MLKTAASKVAWVGRTASMVFGLALVLALVLGVATTALSATGANFILGKGNTATTPTSLVSTLADAAKSAFIVQNKSGGPALDLRVGNATTPANDVAPMKVNSNKVVTNLNADTVDGKSDTDFYAAGSKVADSELLDGQNASAFLPANGKAADADTLDGQDSSAFAGANHNHDSSYIQQSPVSAENASIYIDGTMRTSGMLRTGSETGTSNPPVLLGGPVYNGLVVRHINSTFPTAGQVVARTDQLRLERDGSFGGLRIAWDASANINNSVNCMGISNTGAAVNHYSQPVTDFFSAGTAQVFTNDQNVVYTTCSFGDSFNNRHVTQVTLQRRSSDNWWVGTVISTFNQ